MDGWLDGWKRGGDGGEWRRDGGEERRGGEADDDELIVLDRLIFAR